MRKAWLRRPRAVALVIGGVVVALVAATVVWVAVWPHVPDPASLTLPAKSFVAEDGTTYTRVAVAYLDTSKRSSVEVDVPPGRTPLSVYAACALARPRSEDVSVINVDVTGPDVPSGFGCLGDDRSPEVVDIDRSALSAGGRLRLVRADTAADGPADAPAAWAFGIYSWTIPATLRPPPAAPPAPPATEGESLVREYHGVWPAQKTVRISVPTGGKRLSVAFACTSAIAEKRITFVPAGQDLVDADGRVLDADPQLINTSAVRCAGVSADGSYDSYVEHADLAEPTATLTLSFDPIFNQRGGSWTVAVYAR